MVSNPVWSAEPLKLIADLGCAHCHQGLPEAPASPAPDLHRAGERYRAAYLFAFLQNPERIRPALSPARMPNFRLTPAESLALTQFLMQHTPPAKASESWPDLPSLSPIESPLPPISILLQGFPCLQCHALEGQGSNLAPDLTQAALRHQSIWLQRLLIAPSRLLPKTTMPALFYQQKAGQWSIQRPEASQEIMHIVHALEKKASPALKAQETAYQNALPRYPQATPERGQQIFQALNCGACHPLPGQPPAERNAPDLTGEGDRVKISWLRAYLQKPWPIRPFGTLPGTGNRMPDFQLSTTEAQIIAEWLGQQQSLSFPEPVLSPLSNFQRHKTLTLLQEKWDCLGCHRWGEEGGRIAPDLSQVASRLKAGFVAQMLLNPQKIIPGTLMPKSLLPAPTQALLVNFLMTTPALSSNSLELSLTETPLFAQSSPKTPLWRYQKFCSPCHGLTGDGKGYNAAFLPRAPTIHREASMMSLRPDDTLFDGIHAGAAILGKSPRMPAWGATFEAKEIREFVGVIRQLCQCSGPGWASMLP